MGKTVSELKEGMSYEEAGKWGQYRKKHGPFTVQARVEYGFALLAAIQTGEKSLKKFIPWSEEEEATPEGIFGALNLVTKGVKKNGD